jgi:hypothetical protein
MLPAEVHRTHSGRRLLADAAAVAAGTATVVSVFSAPQNGGTNSVPRPPLAPAYTRHHDNNGPRAHSTLLQSGAGRAAWQEPVRASAPAIQQPAGVGDVASFASGAMSRSATTGVLLPACGAQRSGSGGGGALWGATTAAATGPSSSAGADSEQGGRVVSRIEGSWLSHLNIGGSRCA